MHFNRPVYLFPCILTIPILITGQVSAEEGVAEKQKPVAVSADHVQRAKLGTDLFKKEVRSILIKHCLDCHGGKSVKADFDLSTRAKLLDSGYVEKMAKGSHLIDLITHEAEPHMPLKAERLPAASINAIRRWIDLGAPFDKPLVDQTKTVAGEMVVTDDDRFFWSFQPLREVAIPDINPDDWCRSPIDRFILAKQAELGIEPNAVANRRTLLRRAKFDLLGLPVTSEEVQSFIDSEDESAWSDRVQELLDSPQFGERWAQHWMDVARFGESHGYEQDYNRSHAYHYRDFLIKAFNSDMPFDQFLKWQLAGDEIAPENPLAMMATGFQGAGVFPTQLTEEEFESARYDELDDIVTTTGVAFLGLSVGCARCHDHKFDPIPSRDYYRMAATFTSTIRSEIELDLDPAGNRTRKLQWDQQLATLQQDLNRYETQELPAKFSAWLKEYKAEESQSPWEILNIQEIQSSGGSKYAEQSDGSWLAIGTAPGNEVITITATSRIKNASKIRIEALKDKSLPNGGPGRANNGNFALGQIDVSIESKANLYQVNLSGAQATHQQNAGTLSVAASIDADPISGWAVDAGGIGKDQAAVFQFSEPVQTEEPFIWKVQLTFNHPNQRHSMGRFRMSVSNRTDAPVATGQDGLSPGIVKAIEAAKANGDQNSRDWKFAQQWYAKSDADWVKKHNALQAHQGKGPAVQLTKVMVSSEGFPHMSHHADGRGYPHFYPETHYLNRGDVHQKQEVVQTGFLQVITPSEEQAKQFQVIKPEDARTSHRRTALANWMTNVDDGAGALVARVIVNRVWQHHFGRGLVSTPNDFGISGERPSHPDLLEWLANDLVQNGWQLKRLHHMIMTSSVYMQSSQHDEQRASIDRSNQSLWKWSPRRLEAEAIRDSMLAVSGKLDLTMYGPGTLNQDMKRRSIYFFIKRSQLIPIMMLFDWPEHLVSIGQRSQTTIAPQALMFLNSKQGREYAQAFAELLSTDSSESSVTHGFEIAFARTPTEREQELCNAFIKQQLSIYEQQKKPNAKQLSLTDFCQMLMSMNEFVYIE